jgi:hypothetical protein
MAGTELKDALKNTADSIAAYVKNVATLTVETQTVEVGATDKPRLAARTVISLDGDNTSVIPAQKNEAGNLQVDSTLYELHMQNVQAAIDYRGRMLDAMLGLLKSRLS